MTWPKKRHFSIHRRLRKLLESAAPEEMVVDTGLAFRPLPEYELWAADVAVVSGKRWEDVDPEDNLRGAPELAVEVLSPSNSKSEMLDRQEICLANGCLEFWIVDPKRWRIQVAFSGRPPVTSGPGQSTAIPLFGPAAAISVDAVFE